MWKYDEGTAARRLDDDGQKLRIDRAERRVPAALRHAYIVVALFALQRLAEHVPELGASHHTKRHLPLHRAHTHTDAHTYTLAYL